MDKKKIIGVIVILAVIAIVALLQRPNPLIESDKNNEQVFDPQNPNFTMGEFVSAQDNEIKFISGGVGYTARYSDSTKLVKQVLDGKNGMKLVNVQILDFKPKNLIVVYFSSPAQNGVYAADKVQIISQ